MTHKFTTPCFIRINTRKLRKKLEELGYKLNNGKAWGRFLVTFRIKETNEWKYVASPEWDLQNNPDIDVSIDCGTNEELFLALCALREDTDANQWFVDNVGSHWEKKDKNCQWDFSGKWAWDEFDTKYMSAYMNKYAHKATVKEIMEHFNK